MKLSEGRIGDLVVKDFSHLDGFSRTREGAVGFIVGISENNIQEPVFLVQFQDELDPKPIHPANISKYEDY